MTAGVSFRTRGFGDRFMPDLHSFLLFLAAGLLLNITPGADMLFATTQAARHGLRHGIAAALGVFTGTLAHIVFAIAGLSALLASSATAFALVKWIGAAYLVWLGLQLLLRRPGAIRQADPSPDPASAGRGSRPDRPYLARVWRRGALINLLNPKVALFFVAFLPQFIDPSAPYHAMALAVLGLSFNVTGTLVNIGAAVLAAHAARLPAARRLGALAQRAVGVMFIGLGARLALDESVPT